MIYAKRFAILQPLSLADHEFHSLDEIIKLAKRTGEIIRYDDTHCDERHSIDGNGNRLN